MPSRVVVVNIEKKHGWYIATSKDIQGLIVCHQSLLSCITELPSCIHTLIKLSTGEDCVVEERPSLDDSDISRLLFGATKVAA